MPPWRGDSLPPAPRQQALPLLQGRHNIVPQQTSHRQPTGSLRRSQAGEGKAGGEAPGRLRTYPLQLLALLLQLRLHLAEPLLDVAVSLLGLSAKTGVSPARKAPQRAAGRVHCSGASSERAGLCADHLQPCGLGSRCSRDQAPYAATVKPLLWVAEAPLGLVSDGWERPCSPRLPAPCATSRAVSSQPRLRSDGQQGESRVRSYLPKLGSKTPTA